MDQSAANEVNDFQLIALLQVDLSPLIAACDFTVKFDGHSVRFHVEKFDEAGQRKGSLEVSGLPIDLDLHWRNYASTLRSRNLRVALRPA
jgi:hypothetical protein